MTHTRRRRRRVVEEHERQDSEKSITTPEAEAAEPGGEPVPPMGSAQAEDQTGEIPFAAAAEAPVPRDDDTPNLPVRTSQSPTQAEELSAAVWGPPRRRRLFRRRRQEHDLLSPPFARRTAEPKLVVRLGKPQDPEDDQVPTEPAPGAAAAAPEGGDSHPALIDLTDAPRPPDAAAPEEREPHPPAGDQPRIIHLVDAEDEEDETQPARGWVQRVVAAPEPDLTLASQEPLVPAELAESPEVSIAPATADDEAGPLAHALLRASESPLEESPPARPSPIEVPSGSSTGPLPFIRGIGRTRAREAAERSVPPPVVHIQTIHLDADGEPIVVTKEEAAMAAEREALRAAAEAEAAEREAMFRAVEAEAAEREAVLRAAAEAEAAEREAMFRAATEALVEMRLDLEPHASDPTDAAIPSEPTRPTQTAPAPQEPELATATPWEPEFPDVPWEPEPPAATPWEPEPPIDAPWTQVAVATPASDGPTADPAEHRESTGSPAPVAASSLPPGSGHSTQRDAEIVALPAAEPAQAQPLAESAAPASRRVSRPAAIGPRPDRKPPAGPDAGRPRPKRPDPSARREIGTAGTMGPRETMGAGDPGSNVVSLSTGSAVRPQVTVNLTEEDIQDSDELYEVAVLLDAVTRDPQRDPASPPVPGSGVFTRREQPAPDEQRGRPAAEAGRAPAPAVRPRKPQSPEAGGRPTAGKPAVLQDRQSPRDPAAQVHRQDRPAAPNRPAPAKRADSPAAIARRATARLPERPGPRPGPGSGPRPPVAGSTESTGGRRPDAGWEPAGPRPAEQAAPPKPAAARRRAARPVTLILVDEEGRPQPD